MQHFGQRDLLRMINRSAIFVTPAQPFLDWLHSIDPTSRNMTLEDLAEDPGIYLLPEADTERGAMFQLRRLCPRIFEEQLDDLCDTPLEPS